MTRRERVYKALHHEQPDYTPYQLDITSELSAKVAAHLGDSGFMEKVGNHLNIIEFGGFTEEPGCVFRDQFGIPWNRTVDKDIGIVQDYLLRLPSLKEYTLPDPKDCPLGEGFEAFLARVPDVLSFIGIGFSMFERAWTLRGMENLLVDMYENPAFVDSLLDRITEYNLALIDRALRFNLDGFRFGDDWGQQNGLIMGPRLWRRFIKPRMAAMFQKAKEVGKYVMLHSCGNISELFPELIEIGLDIFNTFQPEVMDVNLIKREYGKDLTFYGGISTQRVLPFASPEEVKAVVREMIRRVGKDGGYIVAPTHAMPRDIPPQNVAAFIEAVQNQERAD